MFKKGTCPNIPVIDNLALEKLQGEWFTHRTVNSAFIPLDCVHTVAEFNPENKTLTCQAEMQLDGRDSIFSDIKTVIIGEQMATDIFGEKLRMIGNIMDTDFSLRLRRRVFWNRSTLS